MRGGFVACVSAKPGAAESMLEHLRWHRGNAVSYRAVGLEIAAFVDPDTGPFFESSGGVAILAHGAPVASLEDLQSTYTRFAALQWDGTRLRATRDPFGLVPLFYRVVDSAIWLATEVAPLLHVKLCAPDLEALCARAAFVPLDERTGWQDIHRVLPGTTLDVDVARMKFQCSRYWFPERNFGSYRGGYREAVAEFRARFGTAVKRCLASEVAILLSGGLDSAAVAIAARTGGRALPHLVHVHYPHLPKTHEQDYAAAVANSVGAPLNTVSGRISPWDIGEELAMHGIPYNWLPYGMDEPLLGHVAQAGIGVALDGHDGDGVMGAPGGAVWGSLVLNGAFKLLWSSYRHYGPRRAARGLAADFVPHALRPARSIRPSTLR